MKTALLCGLMHIIGFDGVFLEINGCLCQIRLSFTLLWIHRQYLLVESIQWWDLLTIRNPEWAPSLWDLLCPFNSYRLPPKDDVWVDRLWGILPTEPWSCCQSFLCVEGTETDPVSNGASHFVFQHSPCDGSQWKVRHTSVYVIFRLVVLMCILSWCPVS